jgi:hypothetical protein
MATVRRVATAATTTCTKPSSRIGKDLRNLRFLAEVFLLEEPSLRHRNCEIGKHSCRSKSSRRVFPRLAAISATEKTAAIRTKQKTYSLVVTFQPDDLANGSCFGRLEAVTTTARFQWLGRSFASTRRLTTLAWLTQIQESDQRVSRRKAPL